MMLTIMIIVEITIIATIITQWQVTLLSSYHLTGMVLSTYSTDSIIVIILLMENLKAQKDEFI